MPVNLLIIDDEPLARERLRRHIAEIGEPYVVVGEADNGFDMLRRCEPGDVDIALVDIRMPRMDGLEAARHLAGLDSAPALIFTTAYDQHAIDAFERNAVDYLLKPIRRERLAEALARARRLSRAQHKSLEQTEPATHGARGHLCARYRGDLHLVPIEDVLYFRADQKYVTARHTGGEVLLEESLKALEDEFGERLLRIHRSTLVAKPHVDGLEKSDDGICRLHLRGCGETLEVSRRHLPEVRAWLKREA